MIQRLKYSKITAAISMLNERVCRVRFACLTYSMGCLLLISSSGPLPAAEPDSLFMSDDIIHLELRADFSAIMKDRAGTPIYHDGILIYHLPDGGSLKYSVRLMVRGNFRRLSKNCEFPPLSVDFDKAEVKNTLFDKQNKLKLVTPCQDEVEVIEEYAIYKMYNRVTDLSLKARLARILYYDTSLDKMLFEKHSFFIEDKDRAAKRNNCFVTNKFFTPFDLDRENYKKMSFFEYLIGNLDWFAVSRKNIIIFQPNDTTLAPFSVPYDFDFSGLVNADYTKPQDIPEYLLNDRRTYKGMCYTEDELEEVFGFYRDIRADLEAVIENQMLIPRSEKKYILSFIKEFYRITSNSNLIKKEFIDVCQTKKDYNKIEE